jgi:hypothetical protein
MKPVQKRIGIMACIGILAASAILVFAQTSTSASLASGGTLTLDHKTTFKGYSHLEIGDSGNPPAEPVQGDNLIMNPSQSVLYATKDIGFGVLNGGSATVHQVEQSNPSSSRAERQAARELGRRIAVDYNPKAPGQARFTAAIRHFFSKINRNACIAIITVI